MYSGKAKLCVAVVATLMAVLPIELWLRLRGYDPLHGPGGGNRIVIRPSSNEQMGYELIPGASGRVFETFVTVNALGYRGREIPLDRGPAKRVVVVGDSVTFGQGVANEDVYPEQLNDLAQRDGSAYEVVNLGVGGYDTLQEVAILEDKGLAYQPDLVVVGYCLNDISVVSTSLEYVKRVRKYQQSILISSSRLIQWVLATIDRWRVGNFIAYRNEQSVFIEEYKDRIDPIHPDEQRLLGLISQAGGIYPSSWYGDDYRVGRLRHAFNQLERLSKQGRSFDVVVMIIPWLDASDGQYRHNVAHQIVAHEAARCGFVVLDLLDAFMNHGVEPLKLRENDKLHPNALGHQLIAQNLHPYLTARLTRTSEPKSEDDAT